MDNPIDNLILEFEDKLTIGQMREAFQEKLFELKALQAKIRCCGVTNQGKRCKKKVTLFNILLNLNQFSLY